MRSARQARSEAELAQEREAFISFVEHGDWGDMGSYLFDELRRTRRIRQDMQRSLRRIAVGLAAGALLLLLIGYRQQSDESATHSIVRDGAVQRVKTVEQRCDLTSKIADVLRKDDPPRVAAFEASARHCEAQRAKVEAIAVRAK